MEFLPEAAGPHDPILVTTERLPGSVRRTTNIDTTRPDGLRADATVDARARDLRTNPDGTTDVVGEARLRATVSPTQTLLSITTSPDVPAPAAIAGRLGGLGLSFPFQRVLREAGTHESEDGSLLYLLLDDLPGATLVSGYVLLRSGSLESRRPRCPATTRPATTSPRHHPPRRPPTPRPAAAATPRPGHGTHGGSVRRLGAGRHHDGARPRHRTRFPCRSAPRHRSSSATAIRSRGTPWPTCLRSPSAAAAGST